MSLKSTIQRNLNWKTSEFPVKLLCNDCIVKSAIEIILNWIIDMFTIICISCLDSNSDGTHSLQSIHWWTSDVMLNFSKSVRMKKQTHLEEEYIFSNFKFLKTLLLSFLFQCFYYYFVSLFHFFFIIENIAFKMFRLCLKTAWILPDQIINQAFNSWYTKLLFFFFM